MTIKQRYSLVYDPVYYVTVVFFAIMTTALPALIGQPIFLLIFQTIALYILLLIPLHRQLFRQTLLVATLWLVTQFITLLVITLWAQERVQLAIPDGFTYGMHYIEWYFQVSGTLRPDGFGAQPLSRMIELIGVTFGSLLTAGLVGTWFLVKATDLAAFHTGVVLLVNEHAGAFLGALPLWALVRIAGYAALTIALAEPLLTSNWNPIYYLNERQRLLISAIGLTLLGLALEAFLPDLWRTLFQ